MKKVAKFHKVSQEQFLTDWFLAFPNSTKKDTLAVYAALCLPIRATKGSAGYDFFSPLTFVLAPDETLKIPTGIRVEIEEGWALLCYPRSGLGFKYRLQLNNTVGVIDSDYYYSQNEGHIFAKMTNDSNEQKILVLQAGDGFMQGIFTPFGLTYDDEASVVRSGGFGITTRSLK